jgi:hypothetical protein
MFDSYVRAHILSDRECDRIISDLIGMRGDDPRLTSDKVQVARWEMKAALQASLDRLDDPRL